MAYEQTCSLFHYKGNDLDSTLTVIFCELLRTNCEKFIHAYFKQLVAKIANTDGF